MGKNFDRELLQHTIDNYNRIAADFSNKRGYLSSDLLDLKSTIKSGDRILDLGCGNGRLSEIVVPDTEYVGADVSEGLIVEAKKRYPEREFVVFDGLKIPFPDNHFDVIFCLAVFHHLPGSLRLPFLREAYRVLKPGGKLVLSVWNLRQEYGKIVYWYVRMLGKFQFGDIYLPFNGADGRSRAMRYIHCFSSDELSREIKQAAFIIDKVETIERGVKRKNSNIFINAHKEAQ